MPGPQPRVRKRVALSEVIHYTQECWEGNVRYCVRKALNERVAKQMLETHGFTEAWDHDLGVWLSSKTWLESRLMHGGERGPEKLHQHHNIKSAMQINKRLATCNDL